jgi:hypothetical protein
MLQVGYRILVMSPMQAARSSTAFTAITTITTKTSIMIYHSRLLLHVLKRNYVLTLCRISAAAHLIH